MTETIVEIQRDRWGRPLIIPPGGGKPEPYTRVSTMAKALDDLSNLMTWKQRKTAQGLLMRPDLLTRIAGTLSKGDPDTDWQTKKALNAICEEATEAAGASKGSSAGTGFHEMTEAIDAGNEPAFVAPADVPRLDAYRKAVAPYSPLAAEVFVVCDELKVAGSFDRLWMCPDGHSRVGDLKTGKSEADYPLATTIQIATYANSKRYNPETGERTELDEYLDRDTGLLVHMPPSGGCQVIPLDLVKGWEAAQLAAQIHRVRKWKPADLIRQH